MNAMRKCSGIIVLLLAIPFSHLHSQTPDSATMAEYAKVAHSVITDALPHPHAIDLLRHLTHDIGHRLSGSPEAAKAVEWGKKVMEDAGLQNVHLEPVMVPHWVRGPVEKAILLSPGPERNLSICALGGSIATPAEGVTGEIIRVTSFDELRKLNGAARGKIVFFDRPFDGTKYQTFEAYGGAVNQRGNGAIEAARAGGVAALVRSMTTHVDDVPHTGAMHYIDSVRKVPAAAVSLVAANLLDSLLASGAHVRVRLTLSCETLPDVESYNVVGELVGSEMPSEVIVVGGHLDSWDKGQGAHDDGAGCCQSIEAVRILHDLGIRPRRTIRVVLFMNEENGSKGGLAYATKDRPGEKPIAAIETDAGGFTPRGFGVDADSVTFARIACWAPLLHDIDADRIRRGGGGADISDLAKKGAVLIGLNVDSQRYFDYHHSDNDTFDKVNERELELGAIAISILSYALAQQGI